MTSFIEQHKLLLGIVAIVLIVALIIVFAGWVWGGIASLFGGGAGRKLLKHALEEQRSEAEQALLRQQNREALAADIKAKQALKERQANERSADSVEIKTSTTRAATQAELEAIVNKEADALERELEKSGGFVAVGMLALILLLAWMAMAMANPPTTQQVSRAQHVASLLRRATTALRQQRERHQMELKKIRAAHSREIKSLESKLASCAKQKVNLAQPSCPPCWQPALVTGLAVAGVCGVAWGSVELGRAIGGVR